MASRKKATPKEEKNTQTGSEKPVLDKSAEPQKDVKKPARSAAKKEPCAAKEDQLLPIAVENTEKKSEKKAAPTKNLPTVAAGADVTPSTVPISFPELEKRSFWSRVLVLFVMLAVLAASVAIFMFRPSEYTERTDSVNFLYLPDTNRTMIAVNGTVRGEVDGTLRHKTYDGTGRVCAALVEDRLYLIKGRKVIDVASNVSDCVLSSNGQALAWRTAANELFYMIVGKKDGTYRISDSATDVRYCLSPDGKEMAYTYERDGVSRMDVYSRTGSKPYFSENEGCYPLGVSDKCRYLYYTNDDGALYVLVKKTGKSVLCGDEPSLGQLIFNRDNTELLFGNGTETRLFVNGERLLLPTLLSTDSIELLPNRRVAIRDIVAGKQYLMESFCDQYYLHYRGTGQMLVFLEKQKNQGTLLDVYAVDGRESITVTDKSVFFLSTSQGTATHTNLYRCKTGKTEVEDPHWDVESFCTNVDGSRILFTDVHGALFAYRLEAFPERMCDTVIEESIAVSADDTFYFYREEGNLWVSDNADQPRLLHEGVAAFFVDGMTAYYVTDLTEDGYGTVYSNYRNTRKDTKIADRVGAIQ
ncbi:MAG: hypothetical protein J6B09_04090 [Clostridia bacterium]|nr:hypothetical protein [Clostridia bacterium]